MYNLFFYDDFRCHILKIIDCLQLFHYKIGDNLIMDVVQHYLLN